MSEKIEYAVDNFGNALKQLKEFLAIQNPSRAEKAGVIQAFEFTFELAWKVLQKKLATQGIQANSPKTAFSGALQIGWIENEALWIKMLMDRNLTIHTYREEIAHKVYGSVSAYADQFSALIKLFRP